MGAERVTVAEPPFRWKPEPLGRKYVEQSETRTQNPRRIVLYHMAKVFMITCCAILAMAFGSYIDSSIFKVAGMLTKTVYVGAALRQKLTSPAEDKRIPLLMASAVFAGAAFNSPDSLIIGFCIRWALGLWCFYVAALLDKGRVYVIPAHFLIYAGKIYIMFSLSTSQKSLLLVLIPKIYLRSEDILESARYGDLDDLDYAKHASDLFSDFKWFIMLRSMSLIGLWLW